MERSRKIGIRTVGDPPYNVVINIHGKNGTRNISSHVQLRIWTLQNINLTYVLFLLATGFELKYQDPQPNNNQILGFFNSMFKKALEMRGIKTW